MSTARRRSGPNEFGSDEQGFTRVFPGSPRSLVQGDRARPERDTAAPLFISDPHGRTKAQEYAGHDESDRTLRKSRSGIPRLIAAGIAIASVGGACAAFNTQIAKSVRDAVSGKVSAASITSRLSEQDITAIPASKPGRDPIPLGDPIVPVAQAALPPVLSGEAMKAASRNALQGQPQLVARETPDPGGQSTQIHTPQFAAASPVPTPSAGPQPANGPIHRLAPDQIASLIRRGDDLIGSGDIAAARLVLRRAAEAGDARAMIKLGATYDPALLSRINNHGVTPDLASARDWYEKAAQLGAPEARRRLEALGR